MHFLIEWDVIARRIDQRVYVARRGSAIIGFLIAAPIPLRQGWLMEQIVRGRAAPNGTNELMLDTAVRDLHTHGASFKDARTVAAVGRGGRHRLAGRAGRAAAAGLDPRAWPALLRLRPGAVQSQVQPVAWDPIHAVAYGTRVRLRTFYAIAGAFGGMSPLSFLGRVAARAARQELRAFSRRAE